MVTMTVPPTDTRSGVFTPALPYSGDSGLEVR